jgi:hypothetical protein
MYMVACHRSATEWQAVRQPGFPDALWCQLPLESTSQTQTQKIQLAFLSKCRVPTTTMYQIQRLFDWIEGVGEGLLIIERAASGARIVTAIADENKTASKPA